MAAGKHTCLVQSTAAAASHTPGWRWIMECLEQCTDQLHLLLGILQLQLVEADCQVVIRLLQRCRRNRLQSTAAGCTSSQSTCVLQSEVFCLMQ